MSLNQVIDAKVVKHSNSNHQNYSVLLLIQKKNENQNHPHTFIHSLFLAVCCFFDVNLHNFVICYYLLDVEKFYVKFC